MWLNLRKWTLALLIALSVQGLAYAKVGEVIFTVGEAKLEGSSELIKRGEAVEVGQAIVTGTNGHVHIRFNDDAFVSVRPNSVLKIERYVYDASEPKNNQVKFTLEKGTSRLITGKAGQANKQGFRLNTPVAAIGIRGTDFIVQADGENARVAVQQGGVTIAPLGQDCAAQALGPCGGNKARDLVGSLNDSFLEVKGQGAAALVQGQSRKVFAMPRPEEPAVKTTDGSQKSAGLPAGMSGSSQLMWGRWSGSAMTPTGYELIGQNDAFVLYRAAEQMNLPTTGYVDFTVSDSQAYGRVGRGGYEDANISKANLSVNFEKMLYTTKFNWDFDQKTTTLYSRGELSDQGRFVADRNKSNVSISGGLGANGDSAAYLFSKKLNNDTNAYGVIHWIK